MSNQSNLELSTQKKAGPVECLGQTFESDAVRRAHYTELLREKLKDPEFRKIEGFPIGEDEDILNLSDPPYYTACPNPWIGDFIQAYGRPYDPKEKYHREPFAADVSEGKNHPIYNAHSYHTKVPHRAIMRYILHYTNPGDVVFDGFCGTGMTGVAAQLCGDEKEVRELGYRVDPDGTIYNEEGKAFSKLGARRAVLNDLSPAATFIAYNYNTSVDVDADEIRSKLMLDEVEAEYGWMYETTHTDGSVGKINFTVWSDVFSCPDCAHEIVFWDAAVNTNTEKVLDEFFCPNCNVSLSKKKIVNLWDTKFDHLLKQTVRISLKKPVLINYSIQGSNKRFNKKPEDKDLELIANLEDGNLDELIPTSIIPKSDKTGEPLRVGITHTHLFYSSRNARVINRVLASPNSLLNWKAHATALINSKMNRWPRQRGPLSLTLYVGSIIYENNVFKTIRNRKFPHINVRSKNVVSTQSSTAISAYKNSLDYVFIDPPFGSNIYYSDLNIVWESWLKILTNNKEEAIESRAQNKNALAYRQLMKVAFVGAYYMLKPGRWITVEFSNTKASVWNSIQTAINESGFVVANVSALDKKQGSFNALTNPTSVKQDLVISAYKPDSQLEMNFAKHGDTLEGVWDFMLSHLKHLPIVKPRAGQLECIAERDPRILYDRMVAFYIGHNTPVPLSSAEFQAALAEKFPERDGMVFLHEQVAEYDKKAALMENTGQLAIFVEDEKSAINWLRQFLKDRPSVVSDITSEFMQQLSASWKKFESRPELALLLEQNFIKYDGEKEVPGQIHGYLSTNFKDMRNKEKDDAALKAKAKDRWYVPDPKNAIDVEAQREKRLLSEFWEYAEQAGITKRKPGDPNQTPMPITEPTKKKAKVKKLKEVRTEAIRAGFMLCNRSKDAATILAVAEILPTNVIEEDEQLQMIVDMAEMRAE
jgi:DNA modification methylase